MDKNTVCLNLYEYNRLRDFEQNISNNYTLKEINYDRSYTSRTFISKDAHVKELLEQINSLKESYGELSNEKKKLTEEIVTLKEKLPIPIKVKEVSLEDLKNMSYWEFRKWKKNK